MWNGALVVGFCLLATQVFSDSIKSISSRPSHHIDNLMSNFDRQRVAGKNVSVGSVLLEGSLDGYYGEITFGTNNQTLKVKFDSGASIFWVPSDSCLSCRNHTRFYCEKSKSCKIISTGNDVKYNLRRIRGNLVREKVKVGGVLIDSIDFIEANFISDLNEIMARYDGVVGLAPFNNHNMSIMSLMREKQLLRDDVFGYYISKGGSTGVLTIGGYEADRISGPMYPIKVQPGQTNGWRFSINMVSFGSSLVLCSKSKNCFSTATTGIKGILAPIKAIDLLYNSIRSKVHFYFSTFIPCQSLQLLPNLTFGINGRNYTMTPEMYTYPKNIDGSLCVIGIEPSQNGEWLLGNLFLKNYYTIHDYDTMTITFANLKDSKSQPMLIAWSNSSSWNSSTHWHNPSGHWNYPNGGHHGSRRRNNADDMTGNKWLFVILILSSLWATLNCS